MMGNGRSVTVRMNEIREIFLHAQLISACQEDLGDIIKKLEGIKPEFQLVAYEAVAMVLALSDLKENNQLGCWRSFAEKISEPIVPHAHLGLGWALARQETSTSILMTIEPAMRFRVVDGWGYYDGTFHTRQTIKIKKIPENFNNQTLRIYDQGVGRSLWYACQGQVNVLQETMEIFPISRHSDLWRGVGIACPFVGGCHEETLKNIASIAAANQIQLAIGATLAAKARIQTQSPTNDIELACRVWCNLSAHEAMLLAVNTENSMEWRDDTWEVSYFEFLSQMIKELTLVSVPVLESQSK